jgi:hypothetical protein
VKFSATVFILTIIISVMYIVIFSIIYPLVEITGGIVGLFSILGLATSLVVAHFLRKRIG